MPPNVRAASQNSKVSGSLETDIADPEIDMEIKYKKDVVSTEDAPRQISWRSLSMISVLHFFGVWGCYRFLFTAMWQTSLSALLWGWAGGIGITAGAHRLWAHRAYKANVPYRVAMMLLQTLAGQNSIFEWVRDHRLHHRHSETHADPHNARRGFWFAHCGWLMVRKHPEVIKQGAKTDMSDILADPVVEFQRRYYLRLMLLINFVIPTAVAVLGWGEDWLTAFLVCGPWKYIAGLHSTWLVNSAAHIWGNHPYDVNIHPAENHFVAWAAMGEGWHNYHHVFPWDYRTAELPGYYGNVTTAVIDFFAWLGWTYDCKTVSREVIERRALRNGDGSWKIALETKVE